MMAVQARQLLISYQDPVSFPEKSDREFSIESFSHLFNHVPIPIRFPDEACSPLPQVKAQQLFAQFLEKVPHTDVRQEISSDKKCSLHFKTDPNTRMETYIETITEIADQMGITYLGASSSLLKWLKISNWVPNASWESVVRRIVCMNSIDPESKLKPEEKV